MLNIRQLFICLVVLLLFILVDGKTGTWDHLSPNLFDHTNLSTFNAHGL
jgi:hypothetical protein